MKSLLLTVEQNNASETDAVQEECLAPVTSLTFALSQEWALVHASSVMICNASS